MGVVITGIIAVIVIAIGASFVLRAEQEPAWQAYSTGSARVGDPGHNLVGTDYNGEPGEGEAEAEGEET